MVYNSSSIFGAIKMQTYTTVTIEKYSNDVLFQWHLRTQAELDLLWQDLRARFLHWNEKYQHLNIPIELDETNKCINIGKINDLILLSKPSEWTKAYYDFKLRVAPIPRREWPNFTYTDTDYKKEMNQARAIENTEIHQCQRTFEQTYSKPAVEEPFYFNVNQKSSKDVIEEIGRNDKIQFIILAEHHNEHASWLWLNEHKYELAKAGINTIALEFYGIWQQEALDVYFRGETNEAPPTEGILIEGIRYCSWFPARSLMLEALRRAGIRGVGIETEQSVDSNGNGYSDGSARIKTLDKATPFALNRQGLLRPSAEKTLLWVGAAHAEGMAQWLGADRCVTLNVNDATKLDDEPESSLEHKVVLKINEKTITEPLPLLSPINYEHRYLYLHRDKKEVRALYQSIIDLYNHGAFLHKIKNHSTKGSLAEELALALCKKANDFFNVKELREIEISAFRKEMFNLLNEEKYKVGMAEQRDKWAVVLANVFIALTVVGAVIIAAKSIRAGELFLFQSKTKRESLVDKTAEAVLSLVG